MLSGVNLDTSAKCKLLYKKKEKIYTKNLTEKNPLRKYAGQGTVVKIYPQRIITKS